MQMACMPRLSTICGKRQRTHDPRNGMAIRHFGVFVVMRWKLAAGGDAGMQQSVIYNLYLSSVHACHKFGRRSLADP